MQKGRGKKRSEAERLKEDQLPAGKYYEGPAEGSRHAKLAGRTPDAPATAPRGAKQTGTARSQRGAAAGPSSATPKTPAQRRDSKSTKRKRTPAGTWVVVSVKEQTEGKIHQVQHRTNAKVRATPGMVAMTLGGDAESHGRAVAPCEAPSPSSSTLGT